MAQLGVNIDHVATLRQARGEGYPDPVKAAQICEQAGAHSIVCHLREDRRHIQDDDVRRLRASVTTRLNLEMSLSRGIVDFACEIFPDQATLVPEKRQELTTEGGLDVITHLTRTRRVTQRLQQNGIAVSLFIDPDFNQIQAAKETGATMIELHTGEYANASSAADQRRCLTAVKKSCAFAQKLGLIVHAGHGLKYDNAAPVAQIPGMGELNIGHSIICQAVFDGLDKAVRDMTNIIK